MENYSMLMFMVIVIMIFIGIFIRRSIRGGRLILAWRRRIIVVPTLPTRFFQQFGVSRGLEVVQARSYQTRIIQIGNFYIRSMPAN